MTGWLRAVLISVYSFLLSVFFLHVPTCGKPRRNVLVILADDGGFMQTAYNNSVCNTPNLDKLAARSVIFKRGYTSVSSCSPSRSVLLTGLPQHQNGMYGIQGSVQHFQSFDGVHSLPVILSQNGVRTGLIGKKHVAPDSVYKFDYERSTNQYNGDMIGRNITFMKHFVREFLNMEDGRPFFLFLAFHDPHRDGDYLHYKFGPFKDQWGNGQPGMGHIPDWVPDIYDPDDVLVPYFLPDTPATRADIAAMYTSFNRMDQGIGIFLEELKTSGHLDDTLILWTSDNGIPFPNAKTNLYEPGMGEPMMVSSPDHKENWGKYSNALASSMDFAPTILDWYSIKFPEYKLNKATVQLTGNSLLPLAAEPDLQNYTQIYSSHNLHGVFHDYPMRVLVQGRYRLIHNLNNRAPYPVATDVFGSPTYKDMLSRHSSGQSIKWFKTLQQYYYRREWELFDLENDPHELKNLASDPEYQQILHEMNSSLNAWQWKTVDPWRCMPHAVLQDKCHPMLNEIPG